ncbi:hypothetical protein PVK06_019677 [Gossypium arboreum]|uniref:Uncharacterized protein n=1 Tax=Gossypium arboreum TaxID=29729 RepID=A0ABR0PKN9_GOSAR|nr:hypothetical protein PVK06_019677 [Gossypium arboreum]
MDFAAYRQQDKFLASWLLSMSSIRSLHLHLFYRSSYGLLCGYLVRVQKSAMKFDHSVDGLPVSSFDLLVSSFGPLVKSFDPSTSSHSWPFEKVLVATLNPNSFYAHEVSTSPYMSLPYGLSVGPYSSISPTTSARKQSHLSYPNRPLLFGRPSTAGPVFGFAPGNSVGPTVNNVTCAIIGPMFWSSTYTSIGPMSGSTTFGLPPATIPSARPVLQNDIFGPSVSLPHASAEMSV